MAAQRVAAEADLASSLVSNGTIGTNVPSRAAGIEWETPSAASARGHPRVVAPRWLSSSWRAAQNDDDRLARVSSDKSLDPALLWTG
jgi:hypothetical protein